MTDKTKIYWEIFNQFYSNEELLREFQNLLLEYLPIKTGNIIDIGCGPSRYILYLLNSDFDLYAVDNDPLQRKYLKI